MDQRSGYGSLVVTCLPTRVTANVHIDLSTRDGILNTFKQIERSHWDYLDQYRDYNRRKYPTINIKQYSTKLLREKGHEQDFCTVENYLRQYNRYKKSLPTAGVILYHLSENTIEFVVVRMRFTDIWSMPKGKKDPEDTNLVETAKREFYEETGLDVDDCINENIPAKTVNKTKFYMLESDHTNHRFNGYNIKEIAEVAWVTIAAVRCNRWMYSKQTVAVADHLKNRFS